VQVFILEGVNMQAAANISPDQNDYGRYQNIQQSLLLRFGIAAVWFFILGVAQVGRQYNSSPVSHFVAHCTICVLGCKDLFWCRSWAIDSAAAQLEWHSRFNTNSM